MLWGRGCLEVHDREHLAQITHFYRPVAWRYPYLFSGGVEGDQGAGGVAKIVNQAMTALMEIWLDHDAIFWGVVPAEAYRRQVMLVIILKQSIGRVLRYSSPAEGFGAEGEKCRTLTVT